MKKVSNSNTKAEILNSYEQLLNLLKEERAQNTALKRELDKKQKLVSAAEEQTKGGSATQNIQTIRQTLNEQLDKMEEGMAREQQIFEQLQEAIVIEKETLENLYKVKAEAESLEALIFTNKQASENLEKELAERKEKLQEQIDETKSQWQREQEEYEYNLKIKRRDEEDAYRQKKTQQEKELAEQKIEFEKNIAIREEAIAEQEKELEHLRKEVGAFESRLQAAVKNAEQTTSEQLTKEFDYRQKLETKDLEAGLQLHQQEIESLKAKVNEQQEFINALTSKTENATQQVKDIALKAIENAGIRSLTLPSQERGQEKNKD